jgi:hypothetical protein
MITAVCLFRLKPVGVTLDQNSYTRESNHLCHAGDIHIFNCVLALVFTGLRIVSPWIQLVPARTLLEGAKLKTKMVAQEGSATMKARTVTCYRHCKTCQSFTYVMRRYKYQYQMWGPSDGYRSNVPNSVLVSVPHRSHDAENIQIRWKHFQLKVTIAILTNSGQGIDKGKWLTLRHGEFRTRHRTESTSTSSWQVTWL